MQIKCGGPSSININQSETTRVFKTQQSDTRYFWLLRGLKRVTRERTLTTKRQRRRHRYLKNTSSNIWTSWSKNGETWPDQQKDKYKKTITQRHCEITLWQLVSHVVIIFHLWILSSLPICLVFHTVERVLVFLDYFLGLGFLAPDLADVEESADEDKEEKTSWGGKADNCVTWKGFVENNADLLLLTWVPAPSSCFTIIICSWSWSCTFRVLEIFVNALLWWEWQLIYLNVLSVLVAVSK